MGDRNGAIKDLRKSIQYDLCSLSSRIALQQLGSYPGRGLNASDCVFPPTVKFGLAACTRMLQTKKSKPVWGWNYGRALAFHRRGKWRARIGQYRFAASDQSRSIQELKLLEKVLPGPNMADHMWAEAAGVYIYRGYALIALMRYREAHARFRYRTAFECDPQKRIGRHAGPVPGEVSFL